MRDDLLRARIRELATAAFDDGEIPRFEPSEKARRIGQDLVGADPKSQARALKALAGKGADAGTLLARAYSDESRALAPIERHIAELENRRRRLIDDLECLRANRALLISDCDLSSGDDF